MDPTGVRQRGIGLIFPGETVNKAAESLLGDYSKSSKVGDPLPTTKGAPMRLQFSEWGYAFLWAPYSPKYPFRWTPWLITMFMTFLLALAMAVVVPVTASWPTSTTVNLNVALVTVGILLLGMSVRAADHIPQLMAPYLVFVESMHGHIGILSIGIWMIGCMLGGAALSAPILNAMGAIPLLNYATATRPIAFWGAVGLTLAVTAFTTFMFEQNTPVKHYHLAEVKEKKGSVRGFHKTSIFFSLSSGLAVFITYGNGLYSVGNFVVTFGTYINTGGWNSPDTAACTLDLAWSFVGGLAGWALHFLTWNVKGLTKEEVQEAVEEEVAADVEA